MDGVGKNIQIAVYDGDTLERTFDDVTRQGALEGLTFAKNNNQLLLLYNRGARIVLGMPKGFYEGYDKEISEVFSYDIS